MRSDAWTRRFALKGVFAPRPRIVCLASVLAAGMPVPAAGEGLTGNCAPAGRWSRCVGLPKGVILLAFLALVLLPGCSSRGHGVRGAGSPRYGERDVEVLLPADLRDSVNCRTPGDLLPAYGEAARADTVIVARQASRDTVVRLRNAGVVHEVIRFVYAIDAVVKGRYASPSLSFLALDTLQDGVTYKKPVLPARGRFFLSTAEGCNAIGFTSEAKPPQKGEGPDPGNLPAAGCVTAGCHGEMGKIRRPHSPVRERRCDACHVERSPGHPENPGREFGPGADRHDALCFPCHDALAREIRSAAVLHAPVAQGRCGACHDPHGSDFPALLRKVVWVSEWEAPSLGLHIDVRRLCWECHDRRMLNEKPADVTRFRDRDRNLHFVHAGGRPKERRCKACHETHAGGQPALMRESVPFGTGGWKLPVRFTPTPNGGSCVVGCHRPQEYDRGAREQKNP